jgi:hypothetical protein
MARCGSRIYDLASSDLELLRRPVPAGQAQRWRPKQTARSMERRAEPSGRGRPGRPEIPTAHHAALRFLIDLRLPFSAPDGHMNGSRRSGISSGLRLPNGSWPRLPSVLGRSNHAACFAARRAVSGRRPQPCSGAGTCWRERLRAEAAPAIMKRPRAAVLFRNTRNRQTDTRKRQTEERVYVRRPLTRCQNPLHPARSHQARVDMRITYIICESRSVRTARHA